MSSNIRKTMVKVSALAFIAAPFPAGSVRAQNLQISCNQDINFGRLIAPGCSGRYNIAPTGAAADTAGCLIINAPAIAGTCTLKVTGKSAIKSADVTFRKNFIDVTGTMGGSAKITSFQMKLRSQPTIATKLTVGTATLNAGTVTIDFGASVNYNTFQTEGSYSGSMAIKAVF